MKHFHMFPSALAIEQARRATEQERNSAALAIEKERRETEVTLQRERRKTSESTTSRLHHNRTRDWWTHSGPLWITRVTFLLGGAAFLLESEGKS
ncbi:hypothetical protein HDU87_005815 [Geranomyces variabilis]|uniref:Uncharacterized protein n=1 Tax=Geranomyces variabilis TaxID=109894 RepID=A0AAD5TLN5_9FUNG|nr:hypothetical protein HDU87_005815 [Geranomyces variabilis]